MCCMSEVEDELLMAYLLKIAQQRILQTEHIVKQLLPDFEDSVLSCLDSLLLTKFTLSQRKKPPIQTNAASSPDSGSKGRASLAQGCISNYMFTMSYAVCAHPCV